MSPQDGEVRRRDGSRLSQEILDDIRQSALDQVAWMAGGAGTSSQLSLTLKVPHALFARASAEAGRDGLSLAAFAVAALEERTLRKARD